MNTYKKTFAISRRRQMGIFAACVLLFAIGIWFDHRHVKKNFQPAATSPGQLKNSDLQKYHEKIFTVVNVVDGDTIDIDCPDGEYDQTRIRLWGVDTPETKNPKTGPMYFGKEASGFTKKLTLNKKVRIFLATDKTRGKYGRLLAYVQLPDDRFLNELLVAEGFAYADLRFRHNFFNLYKQLEASARSQKKGLWANVKREQLPNWLQRKKPKFLLQK